MAKRKPMRFTTFVKEQIGKDHLDICAFFAGDIERMAAECQIDWHGSKDKILWDGSKMCGRDGVKGVDKDAQGRTYIFAEIKTFEKDGDSFDYPTIGFHTRQNTHGQRGAKFNALGRLFDEFDKFKQSGEIPKQPPCMSDEEKAALKAKNEADAEARNKRIAWNKAQEPKRYEWMTELGQKRAFSPYLIDKHVHDVAKGMGIKVGRDDDGYFTAFPLYNIDGEFGGLQRIYNETPSWADTNKITTEGFDTTGFFFVIGGNLSQTEMVYICEGLATGLAIFKATGRPVVVCLYANNVIAVSGALAAAFPEVKRVHVADNDKAKPHVGNTGVHAASAAVRDFGGFVFVPEPSKGSDACDVLVNDGLEVLQQQIHEKWRYFNGRFSQHVDGMFNYLQAA